MEYFQHFILTQFNVSINSILPDRDWHDQRFQLFEKFCYPSVYGQSDQNFKWLVFFDSKTPEFFKEKVKKYSNWENFIPEYVGNDDQENFKKIIKAKISDKTEYLITTRIDNDDAIFKDFVKVVQKNFNKQEFEFINFSYGYVWHKGKIYLYKDDCNPFISLIEKVNGVKTVWCEQHQNLYRAGTIKQINNRKYPAWIQVKHKRNIRNRLRGWRVPIDRIHSIFGINPESFALKENKFFFWIDKIFLCSVRQFRERFFKISGKIRKGLSKIKNEI